jgi:Concanavalin A-like lectin/glucanases superfamily
MKTFVPFPMLLVIFTATGSQAAPIGFQESVLADRPIAYYQFNEQKGASTAIDAAGANNGAYSSTGISLQRRGIGGGDSGALFDGQTGTRVIVPDNPTLNPPRITIEALVRWNGPNGFQQRIVEKSFFLGGEQALYNLSVLDSGHVQAEFRSSGPVILTSRDSISRFSSHHLAATFAADTPDPNDNFKLFVDGQLVVRMPHPYPNNFLQSSPTNVGIGNQVERDRPFMGLIDEVVIYDRALSDSALQQHYLALGCPPRCTP